METKLPARFTILRPNGSAKRPAGAGPIVLLTAVALMACLQSTATAQLTAEALIGDAVPDPKNSKYSDVSEAIKRYGNNDTLGAKQFLESAKRKHDRLPPVNMMLAKMYFLSGKTAAGLQAIEATARESPGDPEPYLLLADQAVNRQQAIQAIALYDKAIELIDKYDSNGRRKRKFVIRARAGRSAVQQRWLDWEAAEADLKVWLKEDPEDANAHNRMGAVQFMLGNERAGFEAFQKAKSFNKDLPSPFVSAASMYQRLAATETDSTKQKEYQSRARQSFERAYKESKTDKTTLLTYADWLLKQDDLETAGKVLAAARQSHGGTFQVQLLSGVQAQMTGNAEAAEKYYNQTIALSPGNRDAHNLLSVMLVNSDDKETQARAEAIARLNARLNENSSDANIALAWVLRQTGKAAEAGQAYQKGIRLGTLSADSKLLVAKLLVEQKRPDVARGLLEEALQKEQGIFVNRAEGEALLGSLN